MDTRIMTVIQLMNKKDSASQPTLDELAEAVRLSSSRLRHLFREQTGITLWRYQNRLRMRRVAWLLTNTQLPLKEIRYQVGIADESHFHKFFKREFGMTPRRFRETAWMSSLDDLLLTDDLPDHKPPQ